MIECFEGNDTDDDDQGEPFIMHVMTGIVGLSARTVDDYDKGMSRLSNEFWMTFSG